MSEAIATTPRATKLPGLQALRAVAASLVILDHLNFYYPDHFKTSGRFGNFSFGYIGVSVFFIISGFIITHVHWDQVGDRSKIGEYLRKRFFRICPLFWAALLINYAFDLIMYGWSHGYAAALVHPEPYGWWLFLQNVVFLGKDKILGPSWTLSYEMLFYVWFGLCVFLGRRWLAVSAVLWFVGILAARAMHFGPQNYILEILLDRRTGLFLVGVGLAAALRFVKISLPGLAVTLAGVPLLWLALALPQSEFGSIKFSILEIVGLGLIVAGGAVQQGWPVPRWLMFLGEASYSTYLVHPAGILAIYWACDAIYGAHQIDLPLWAYLASFVFVILLSLPVHLYLERPLMNLVSRKRPQPAILQGTPAV
jgi:peptidoglycan/LPS O-acetylase OafA/YrhL